TLLCMALLAAFVATWGYLLRAPANYRQQRKLWGADSLEKEVAFYESHIQQVSPLGRLSFRYEDIGRVVQNKTVLVMVINNAALLIQKDGFTKGAAPEFEAFLRQKAGKKE
ncbi:MAG: YcxB family protein, partial [Oscillospiraceae bacterium]